MRVAAAENPSVKWGGSDLGAYEVPSKLPSKIVLDQASEGDVFGRSLQVNHMPGLNFADLVEPRLCSNLCMTK